ncbi:MAG: succinate dehydrogenase cytochrome b subunit [Bacteroidales bacterium]|nr:succinate dehydrogenase cytochrome b subunit [Bacteroidales bacterium]
MIMALSSITKKLIMSVSGLFLIVFLLLHMTINLFSVVDTFKGTYGAAEGLFQAGCDFMALPIVTIMVPVLAFGFVFHILYAFILTAGNIKARGGVKRYEGGSKGKSESWASKNMLILGIVVLGLVAFHLNHFWAEMQLKEFQGHHAENPYLLLNATFQNGWMVVLYVIWFAALGLHLCHGFWSAFQTIGMSNSIWEKRLYFIGKVVVGIIVLGFSAVAVNAFLQANGLLCCGCC